MPRLGQMVDEGRVLKRVELSSLCLLPLFMDPTRSSEKMQPETSELMSLPTYSLATRSLATSSLATPVV